MWLHRNLGSPRLALCVGLTLCLTSTAFAGGFLDNSKPKKQQERPTWAEPAKRMEVEGEGNEPIIAELHNAKLRVEEARQNATTADYNLTRARTRRYPRGEALEEIKSERDKWWKEREAAEREFTVLVEKARRAGVPNGTLMPYMDLADQIRRDQSTRKAEGEG